jgi:hypothetical protein
MRNDEADLARAPITHHPSLVTPLIVVLCLLLAGCGLIQIGVSNSPDWCPSKESKGCL